MNPKIISIMEKQTEEFTNQLVPLEANSMEEISQYIDRLWEWMDTTNDIMKHLLKEAKE